MITFSFPSRWGNVESTGPTPNFPPPRVRVLFAEVFFKFEFADIIIVMYACDGPFVHEEGKDKVDLPVPKDPLKIEVVGIDAIARQRGKHIKYYNR